MGSSEDNIQMNVGKRLPQMWGFRVGIWDEKKKTPPQNGRGSSDADTAYINPSSIARLTAARRLLTLSLL